MKKLKYIILFLLLSGNIFAAAPEIFFTNLEDGPTTGWEESATKGAAITVYGYNFGAAAHTSYVTVANVTASTSVVVYADESGVAEWGATTNPDMPVFNGKDTLQRITFYLNSSMGVTGTFPNSTITVTNSDGTSKSVYFHARALGDNHIRFYALAANDGNDSNDGLYATQGEGTNGPRLTMGQMKQDLQTGDIAYIRGGEWTAYDTYNVTNDSWLTLYWTGFHHANGTQGNSIGVIGYPGDDVYINPGGVGGVVLTRKGTGSQWHHWTISNMSTKGHWTMGCLYHYNCDDSYNRFVGLNVDGVYDSNTTMSFNCGRSNDHTYLLGNNMHDSGCGIDQRGCDNPKTNSYLFSISGAGNLRLSDQPGTTGHTNFYVMYNELQYGWGHLFYVFGHAHGDIADEIHIAYNYGHDTINGTDFILGGGDNNRDTYNEGAYGFVEHLYVYGNVLEGNMLMGGTQPTNTAGNGGEYFVYNNTVYNPSGRCFSVSEGVAGFETTAHFINNVCYESINGAEECTSSDYANCDGTNNLFYGYADTLMNHTLEDLTSDPLFTNVSIHDYRLQSESPAKDSGSSTVSGVLSTDINRVTMPQNDVFDRGAFEWTDGSGEPEGDTSDPFASIIISNLIDNSETYTDRVIITGACTDNVGADVIRIKEDSAPANESDGSAFTSPYTLTLTSSGAKSVRIRCWDAANNSNTASQNFYFRPVSIAGGGMN